ncbi:methionyl-tRNA formyltransferase [Ruminococcus sp. LCP21S3_E8]|nr:MULTISPECIES: methionyl-tRNA formyltransferase [Ruminococcus]MCI5616992.1 methionyl-tRNA formyltransferase [Ruminococcus sp.]MCI6506427.1 methionyl-tRNA formyltransferase [Ruminococcus sp.]MDD6532189.1 methionyl-tRNA formyltransferase [Ruminococcus sp.]MDD6708985.1 methionyl-tRNA formyltransferase [Ruminococcus sp.]MDY3661405.1 methionyl-tRNA formyltransferase [Ruminococcus bovis]
MNVVFMGTPDFAVPSLENIAKVHNVQAVFTQPDKPVGRKMVLTPPDVKVCAEKLGIPVYQPVKLKDSDSYEIIKELNPDVIVVVAYGQILPENILNIPKYGCINVHGSLLPKYRGAAPIQWSVLNGDKVTGVTTMYMEKGLDTGDILETKEYEIGINDTAGEVFDTLAEMGGKLILDTLEKAEKGQLHPIKQDDSKSSYAKMLDKSMCNIDFSKTNLQVHNQVRGLSPWPVASTKLNGKVLKIFETRLAEGKGKPGEILNTNPLTIACGEGAVVVNTVQLQGKKKMDSKAFLQGHKLEKGTVIGE